MIRTGLRRHARHRKGGGGGHGPLALIPMIDMLTILVVYLLVHAADMEILPNSKNISIPQSNSELKPREATVVMVTRDMLYVNGDPVVTVAELGASTGQVSEPLRMALGRQAEGLLPGSEAHREVTVMAEKSLPYSVLRKIVASSSAAEYTKVSLAVVEREQTTWARQAREARIAMSHRPAELTASSTCRGRRRPRKNAVSGACSARRSGLFIGFGIVIPLLPDSPERPRWRRPCRNASSNSSSSSLSPKPQPKVEVPPPPKPMEVPASSAHRDVLRRSRGRAQAGPAQEGGGHGTARPVRPTGGIAGPGSDRNLGEAPQCRSRGKDPRRPVAPDREGRDGQRRHRREPGQQRVRRGVDGLKGHATAKVSRGTAEVRAGGRGPALRQERQGRPHARRDRIGL